MIAELLVPGISVWFALELAVAYDASNFALGAEFTRPVTFLYCI